jgi:hypothetical protein
MKGNVQRSEPVTIITVLYSKSRVARGLLISFLLFSMLAIGSAVADDLQNYAAECDLAIGPSVQEFDCDAGTEVPGQGSVFSRHQPGVTCDQPNRLNKECDPGSRFQVLTRTDDAYIVAHCRKEGGDSGMYGDIAVIQYSRKNGATCFYQALGDQSHGNMPGGHTAPGAPPKPVKAPSKGAAPNTFWLPPSGMVRVDHCGRCHDNGPFIRSPYINQVQGSNELPPGSQNFDFNRDQPYGLVGQVFASWKSYKVEISGNECNSCHRLAVSNASSSGSGTALDLAIRATSATEPSKNPPSAQSPIWMPPIPVQTAFNQVHADSARAIHLCAVRFQENPLPNSDLCRITQFAGAFAGPPPSEIPSIVGVLQYVLDQFEPSVEALVPILGYVTRPSP